MNRYKSMMKSRADFVEAIGLILDPEGRVIEERFELHEDLLFGNTEVLVGQPDLPGPLPDLAKHSFVKFEAKRNVQTVMAGASERPVGSFNDILALMAIQFALGGDVFRNESTEFIWIERSRTRWIMNFKLGHLRGSFFFFLAFVRPQIRGSIFSFIF